MVGMTVNRPMDIIKDKSKVNGPGKPKRRVINPMGQCGRNDSQQAHGHDRKRNSRNGSLVD